MSEPIPIAFWGRDHWSTFAYVETRCVDCKGGLNRSHLRCNRDLHPGLGRSLRAAMGFSAPTPDQPSGEQTVYPTRLKGGIKKADHDDWSCIEDMEVAGLLTWEGTGAHPVFVLTDMGKAIAAALRAYKADGGNFADFEIPPELQAKIPAESMGAPE